MVVITPNGIKNSFRYALRGLVHTFQTQQSFRIQSVAAVVVIVLMVYLKVTTRDFIVLAMLIALVMILELINTVVEHLTDLVSARLAPVAQIVKDAMAAAVLFASIMAAVIGGVVFWPYLSR
ncbi:diacylglycerol kinase family protein [Candidatus Parcubacteria bacterium]|jgi:diacylglycerol kinase|nr:MAG: diacylglycerol kinase family protein [Candidatus Parcubacteria bacterium]